MTLQGFSQQTSKCFAVVLTDPETPLHCHPERSEGPGLLLLPLHQTQPPHTVILSEAKDLDFCYFSFIESY
jgi:hypothetical protein